MRVAIGQFGAPTVVLNASLYGAVSTLDAQGADVVGIVGGAHGLAKGTFIPLNGYAADAGWLQYVPGAALRAGRSTHFEAAAEDAVRNLQRQGVDGLLVLGGNGSMRLAQVVQETANAMGYGLNVVGVPKTIDNDIVGVDHTPGYPSAARFVLKALRDLAMDLEAMVGFEQVRVVEVMGRRTGWLAAAAALLPGLCPAGLRPGLYQPLIYVPEDPLSTHQLLTDVQGHAQASGQTLVVISEGVRDASGRSVTQMGDDTGNAADFMLGGIGGTAAQLIRKHLGYGVRYENLGLMQRCWAESALALDREEARRLGQAGAEKLLAGEGGWMVGLARSESDSEPYKTTIVHRVLEDVAGKDRFMSQQERRMDETFTRWLEPLVELDTLKPYACLTGIHHEPE